MATGPSATPAKTTRPRASRGTAPTKAAAAKAAQAAAAPAVTAEAEAAEATTPTRTVVVLDHVGATKSFEKFQAPEGSGCAGNFYAPLGTTEVKVAIIGA